jgi:hypothetical protein
MTYERIYQFHPPHRSPAAPPPVRPGQPPGFSRDGGRICPEISRPDPSRKIFNRTLNEKFLSSSWLKKFQVDPEIKFYHDPNITKNPLATALKPPPKTHLFSNFTTS